VQQAYIDKNILIICEYKNHSKENTTTIICDILNHSQGKFVIEIKQISGPIFFKNEYPNPTLIRQNRKYPAGYPILILSMLTSAVYACCASGRGFFSHRLSWLSKKRLHL